METQRTVLYLRSATAAALTDYWGRHGGRFRSRSQAADHLLARALAGSLGEGTEALLAPALLAAVRESARREIQDGVGALLERQSGRLAALLVQSGNDAHRAARIAEAMLGHLLADPARAARVAEEAQLQAGARYRVGNRTVDASPDGSPHAPPSGSTVRPPGA